MKKEAHTSLASEIPKLVFDQQADTTSELMNATGQGKEYILKLIKRNVEAGNWERVWKKIDGRSVPAYRRKPK